MTERYIIYNNKYFSKAIKKIFKYSLKRSDQNLASKFQMRLRFEPENNIKFK